MAICFAFRLEAQVTIDVDSVNRSVDSLHHVDSLKKRVGQLDSIPMRVTDVIDSTAGRVSSVADKINQRQRIYTDSLQTILNNGRRPLLLERAGVTSKVDSLRSKTGEYGNYSNKLDSINSFGTSSEEVVNKQQEKVNNAISGIENRVSGSQGIVNEKLNVLRSEAGGHGTVPDDLALPNQDVKLSADIPGTDLPSLNVPKSVLPNAGISNPDVGLNVPTIDTDIVDANKVGKITSKTDASGIVDEASTYTNIAEQVKMSDLPTNQLAVEEIATTKLAETEELTILQKDQQLIKEQETRLKSYKNPQEYKKKTLERAKKMVTLQMVAHEKDLQDAISKASKYQRDLGTLLNKQKDLPKKRDAWRRLKRHEKFVPGLTLQIQKPNDAWLIDINSSLRYRLTTYWSIGTGWSERVLAGKYSQSRSETRIFGVRTFSELILFKGFSFRVDAENMNVYMQDRTVQDAGQRTWGWNYQAGMKKDFSFVQHVTGNVQFMYLIYSGKDNPYPSRLNVRFGFEYKLKKSKNRSKK